MRKALCGELSLARSWCTRDWIWGRELKLEELRNLERVEAESERYLASVLSYPLLSVAKL